MVTVIDYDIGNITAIVNMLRRLGIACHVTNRQEDVEKSERIILPGNGSFDACMRNLRASGLIPTLEEMVLRRSTPLLGICVGAQMLGHRSEEGTENGLGWIDMQVKRFPPLEGFRIPHMGWNEVKVANSNHPILEEMDSKTRFYFVHSYFMLPKIKSQILLTTNYGINFASAIADNHIVGVQFHPEKSHRYGKLLLNNFVKRL